MVKGLKLSNSYEDFELKKLLFNIIVILRKDLATVQVKTNETEKLIMKAFYFIAQFLKSRLQIFHYLYHIFIIESSYRLNYNYLNVLCKQ